MEPVAEKEACTAIHFDETQQKRDSEGTCGSWIQPLVSIFSNGAAGGLSPDNDSERDITTQLQSLLPSGYGKSYSKFHLSNGAKVKLRLDCLRRCKAGRISKEREAHRQKCVVQDILGRPLAASKAILEAPDTIDRCAQAFRNYATQSNSPQLLPLTRDLSDAQPVTSSLLLLDGSELASNRTIFSSHPSLDTSLGGLSEGQRRRPQIDNNEKAVRETSGSASVVHVEGSTPSHDIRAIGKLLSAKHSDDSVKQVYRALRLSSGSSLRSNLTSLSSRASSLLSKLSSRNSRPTNADLTKEELKVWNELVDDSKVDIPRPLYLTVLPIIRQCCMPPTWRMRLNTVDGM